MPLKHYRVVGILPPPDPDDEPQRQTITMRRGSWRDLTRMADDESTPKRRFSRHGLVVYLLENALKQWRESKAKAQSKK